MAIKGFDAIEPPPEIPAVFAEAMHHYHADKIGGLGRAVMLRIRPHYHFVLTDLVFIDEFRHIVCHFQNIPLAAGRADEIIVLQDGGHIVRVAFLPVEIKVWQWRENFYPLAAALLITG